MTLAFLPISVFQFPIQSSSPTLFISHYSSSSFSLPIFHLPFKISLLMMTKSQISPVNREMDNPGICNKDEEFLVGIHLRDEDEKQLQSSNAYSNIPDGGYGWYIVLAFFLLNFNTWGANSGFAIYVSYYLNHGTFPGADKYDYACIGGITFGAGLAFAPFINYIQGKIGLRPTMIIGNCFQFAALMLASFANKLWQLYLTQGVLQAIGLALITLPAISVLPQWFKNRRTLASSISAAGTGSGGLVYNLAMQKVLEVKSVYWALRVQAIMCFAITWISIFLLRERMNSKHTLYDLEIMKSIGFWLFFACILCFVCLDTCLCCTQWPTSLHRWAILPTKALSLPPCFWLVRFSEDQ